MQTLIHVVCSKGRSVRDAVANDKNLEESGFHLLKEKQQGRKPGWTKLRGAREGRRGTINIQWNASSFILMCRVVNKGAGRPHLVVGDFIDYLLSRHKRRIRQITIWSQ